MSANDIPCQTARSLTVLRRHERFYFYPYRHVSAANLRNVLIIGAGTGNDVAVPPSASARHIGAAGIGRGPPAEPPMHVSLVSVQVVPEHVAAFIEATRANASASAREPGHLRFDVLRSSEDPNRFILYEAYVDEAAAAAHKTTPHYLAWREAATDWMAEPRVGVRYDGLLPEVPDPHPGGRG